MLWNPRLRPGDGNVPAGHRPARRTADCQPARIFLNILTGNCQKSHIADAVSGNVPRSDAPTFLRPDASPARQKPIYFFRADWLIVQFIPSCGGAKDMIKVQDLVKVFGAKRAVDGVSFSVERGEVLGFLGPNGAGKSTTMRMITGFIPPTSGTVSVGGFDTQVKPHPGAAVGRVSAGERAGIHRHDGCGVSEFCRGDPRAFAATRSGGRSHAWWKCVFWSRCCILDTSKVACIADRCFEVSVPLSPVPFPYSLHFHSAEEPRHLFQRPLRGGEADALQRLSGQRLQPLQTSEPYARRAWSGPAHESHR